jgi:hypothetical protein
MRWVAGVVLLFSAFAPTAGAEEKSWGEARAAMLRGLRSSDVGDRVLAVYEIDGFDNAEAARLVVRAVLSRDDRARVVRAGIQLASGLKSEEAVAALVEEAKKGNWRKRARVLEALGWIENEKATGAVLVAAYDEDMRVRVSALLALMNKESAPAALAAADGLKAEEWPVRSAAMYAVGRMKSDDAVVPLIRRLGKGGEDGRLLEDARRALVRITGKNYGLDVGRWTEWYSRRHEKESVSLAQPRVTPEPTARLGNVVTFAKRVVFVLAVNDTMNKKLVFDPATIAPPDVKKEGGKALKPWLEVKTKLDLARLWTAWAIDHLAEGTEFTVVTYGISANAVFSDFIRATRGNREKAKKRVLSLSASGNANLYDGLRCIFTLVSKDPLDEQSMLEGPGVVYFLSDGAADEGEIKSAFEAFEEVERWNRYRQIRFHCFGVGDHDSRVLADLAGMIPDGQLRAIP